MESYQSFNYICRTCNNMVSTRWKFQIKLGPNSFDQLSGGWLECLQTTLLNIFKAFR